MAYPTIMNGDHAEFEQAWAGKDPKTRPDWPLPSFDAADWAEAFCQRFNVTMDGKPVTEPEGLMIGWFANALMRGFDHREKEIGELRAYLKAFCAATVDPEDQGQDVGRHEANPFIEYEFALVDEDVRPDRTITGGQVRRAMELVGFDKLKIQPSDRTIANELTEARDLRREVKTLRSLLDDALALLEVGDEANTPSTDTYTFIVTAKEALRQPAESSALTTSEA